MRPYKMFYQNPFTTISEKCSQYELHVYIPGVEYSLVLETMVVVDEVVTVVIAVGALVEAIVPTGVAVVLEVVAVTLT